MVVLDQVLLEVLVEVEHPPSGSGDHPGGSGNTQHLHHKEMMVEMETRRVLAVVVPAVLDRMVPSNSNPAGNGGPGSSNTYRYGPTNPQTYAGGGGGGAHNGPNGTGGPGGGGSGPSGTGTTNTGGGGGGQHATGSGSGGNGGSGIVVIRYKV